MIYNDNIYKLIRCAKKEEDRICIENCLDTILAVNKSLPNLSDDEITSCKEALAELNKIAEKNECPIIYQEEGQIIEDLHKRLVDNLKY